MKSSGWQVAGPGGPPKPLTPIAPRAPIARLQLLQTNWRLLASLGSTLLLAALLSACAQEPPDVLASVYRVEVEHCQAVNNNLATAVAVGPGLVATVAHSLDQAKAISLENQAGLTIAAEIVYLDEPKDVAILRLDDAATTPLEFAEPNEASRVSIATASNPGGEGPTSKQATIVDLVTATLDGEGRRAAIKLDADINPGDSGAAVVDQDGRMVGMVFATARGRSVGWAVAVSEISDALAALDNSEAEPLALVC